MKKIIIISIFAVVACLPMDVFLSYASQDVVYKEARPRKDLIEVQKQSEYFYDPTDKPDPFSAFIVKREASLSQLDQTTAGSDQLMKMLSLLADLKKPKTELQRISLSDLVLTSIIKTGNRTMAMVRGPNGMGYIVKQGTYMGKNGGRVEQIQSEEKTTDLGKQVIRRVVIKEPYLDRKGNLQHKEIEMKMSGSSFE
jgi:type IV pilus assembly protein PilP